MREVRSQCGAGVPREVLHESVAASDRDSVFPRHDRHAGRPRVAGVAELQPRPRADRDESRTDRDEGRRSDHDGAGGEDPVGLPGWAPRRREVRDSADRGVARPARCPAGRCRDQARGHGHQDRRARQDLGSHWSHRARGAEPQGQVPPDRGGLRGRVPVGGCQARHDPAVLPGTGSGEWQAHRPGRKVGCRVGKARGSRR